MRCSTEQIGRKAGGAIVASLEVWFSWKDNPDVELGAGGAADPDVAAKIKANLESNPKIDHATIYQRDAKGQLVKVGKK